MGKISMLILAIMMAAVVAVACGNSDAAVETGTTEAVQEATTEAVAEATTEAAAETEQEAAADAAATTLSFGTFKTADVNGNEVTEDIFKQCDYTMVNFWGTYCGPCIREMPEIQEIYEGLPENMQVVGLVIDMVYGVEDQRIKEEADTIIEQTGVKYTNIQNWQEAYDLLQSVSYAVPTTVFVDSDGNVIGDAIIGADIEQYKERFAAFE